MKFLGGPWEPDSRAGTLARFIEAHGSLEKDAFLERVTWPHLVIGADTDPATWDAGIVVRIAPRQGHALSATLGRGPSDVVLSCPTISGQHVRFTAVDGNWSVEDLRSKTGTTIDGQPLEAGSKRLLDKERSKLGIGPDVTATFLAPAAFHAFVAEAIAKRRAGPAAPPAYTVPTGPKKREWPTWSLLQDEEKVQKTPTESELPVLQLEAIGVAPPKPTDEEAPRASLRLEGFDSLFGTRRRALVTLVALAIVAGAVRYVWRPMGIMLFGSTHPEWFVEAEAPPAKR